MAAIKNGPSWILIPRSLSADMAADFRSLSNPKESKAPHAPGLQARRGQGGREKARRVGSGCKRRHSLDQSDGRPLGIAPLSFVIHQDPFPPTLSHSGQAEPRDTAKAKVRARPRRWASMGSTLLKPLSPIGHRVRGCMIEAGAKFVSAAHPLPATPIGVASCSNGELPPETVIVSPK
ncbi:hypothetical protein NA56DRAFT_697808 [Hyaloscypha hepaticicola]|uniref:Uncharacterized protein n=1 Tax=Hyaloscypha hepaticicola TaxID=2082293 RepID=A0A2J6QJZ8_9HELO|nr:hypothetical protein NA56DRAFT_697808 [Hyaloscypha hepaticicola]